MKVWQLPPPTSSENVKERQHKKIVGVVKHNGPIDTDHIKMRWARRWPLTDFSDRLKECMREGWIRRAKDGWVVTESVA